MSTRTPLLDPFDALIGRWTTVATHPELDGAVAGRVSFAWGPGGHYVEQRSRHEHELFPDALCVIGAPEQGDGLVTEYFDERGVRRTYATAIEDDTLRWWRDAPGFWQRFTAPLDRDGFHGIWQLARIRGDWRDDLEVTYRRA